MALTAPPATHYAGDSETWTTTYADYLASASWVATCTFLRAGSEPVSLEGVASGDAHVFTLPVEKSGGMEPGEWSWAVRVIKDGTNKVVATGASLIRPDPMAALAESHNEKCLRLVQAAMEDRLTDVQESISILGQDITLVASETLHALHNSYQSKVNLERKRLHKIRSNCRPRTPRIYLAD